MPACKSSRHPRRLRPADDGVSEVVGFLITFGIIATLLVVAMVGFNSSQSGAEERVARIQADSIAQRVAGVVVEAALFLEKECADTDAIDPDYNAPPSCTAGCGTGCTRLSVLLELPPTLQGHGYTVKLQPGACGGTPAAVKVVVSSAVTGDRGQTLFEAVRQPDSIPSFASCAAADARPAVCDFGDLPNPHSLSRTNGGNVYVVYDGSCLGLANSPV